MRRAEILILIAFIPFLMATDINLSPDLPPPTDDEKRDSLEQFNHELDGVIEAQIEKIAALDPKIDIKDLRKSHYDWTLERELRCAEKRRTDPDRLAELECRSVAAEEYYQQLESRITELENANADREVEPNTPHNQPMQTDDPESRPSPTAPTSMLRPSGSA